MEDTGSTDAGATLSLHVNTGDAVASVGLLENKIDDLVTKFHNLNSALGKESDAPKVIQKTGVAADEAGGELVKLRSKIAELEAALKTAGVSGSTFAKSLKFEAGVDAGGAIAKVSGSLSGVSVSAKLATEKLGDFSSSVAHLVGANVHLASLGKDFGSIAKSVDLTTAAATNSSRSLSTLIGRLEKASLLRKQLEATDMAPGNVSALLEKKFGYGIDEQIAKLGTYRSELARLAAEKAASAAKPTLSVVSDKEAEKLKIVNKEMRELNQWLSLTAKQQAAVTLKTARTMYSSDPKADAAQLPGLAGSQQALSAAQNIGSIQAAQKALDALGVSHNKVGAATLAHAANVKGMSKEMWEAHSAARGLAGGLGALWLTYGATIPLMAGAALSGGFMQATKAGAEFAYQLTFVKALGGETAESIAQIGARALELSKTGLHGPVEMANGLRILSQAGLDASKSMAALPSVLDLATVGEMKMEDAALSLVGVMNAFSLPFSQMSHVGDMFAKAAAVSQTSVQGMTEAMKYASVVGEQYNVSVGDTATALALLAKMNIYGTAAGTSFRNMIKELYAPVPAAASALKKLGLETKDAAGNLRPFADIIYELKGKLEEFDKGSQVQILQRLFGERGAKEAVAMLALTRAEWEKLKSSIENSDGFMSKVSAELEMETKGRFQQALNTMKTNMIEAFNASEGPVRNLADALRDLADSPEFKSGMTAIVGSMAQLATTAVNMLPTLINIGEAWLAFKAVGLVSVGITSVGTALSGLYAAATTAGSVLVTAGVSLSSLGVAATAASAAAASAGSSGIAALATSLGALFGPVGWVVLGVAALTSLAYAFNKLGENKASEKIAADAVSLAGTMERLRDKTWEATRELLRQEAVRKGGRESDSNNDAIELQRKKVDELRTSVVELYKKVGTPGNIDAYYKHQTALKDLKTATDALARAEAARDAARQGESVGNAARLRADIDALEDRKSNLLKRASEKGIKLDTAAFDDLAAAYRRYSEASADTNGRAVKGMAKELGAALEDMEKQLGGKRKASEVIGAEAKGAREAKNAFKELASAMSLANEQATEKVRAASLGEAADLKLVEAGHKVVKLIHDKLAAGKALTESDIALAKAALMDADATDKQNEALKNQNELRRQAVKFREGTLTVDQDAEKLMNAAEATRELGQATQQTAKQAALFAINQMSANTQISESDKRARMAAAGFKDYATGYKALVDETVTAEKGVQDAQAEALLVFADTEEKKLAIKRDAAIKRIDLAFETARKEAEADLDAGPSNKGSLEELEARHQEARAAVTREYQGKLRAVELKDWVGVVNNIDSEFKRGWMSLGQKGENVFKAMFSNVKSMFKNTVMEYIYKAFARPMVLNVVASVGGSLGFSGLANAADVMGGGSGGIGGLGGLGGGGGNIMSLANQGMSLWNMGSAIAGGYGALPGTVAAANLSGMAGGDTLGNFIAMNPHWTAGAGAAAAAAPTLSSIIGAAPAMSAAPTAISAITSAAPLMSVAPTATAVGAASTGAAGLMSTIGAAIPWIGIAIAVASMLSKDRGGPKYEGAQGFNLNTGASFSDELLPDAIRGYTKDDADAQINELMKPVIAGMGTTAKAFGGKLGDDMQARFSLVRDPLGKASSFAGADLFVGDKQVYHSNHDYGRDDKDFQSGVELEAKRLTLASLAFSEGIDPIVQALLRGTDIAEASLSDVDALMARATAVNSLSGTIDSLRNGTTELDRTFSDLLVSGVDKAVADANPFIADALAKITPDAAALNQISLGFDDAGNEIFVTLGESVQAAADAFVAPDVDVAAIQTSLKTGLSQVYQDLIGDFDPMTASAEDTTKLTKTLQGTKILSDTFDRLGFSIAGITADSIHATANLDTFAANTQAYYAAITTPQKQVDDALDALGQQFGKVGLTMPTTVQGFEALVAGVDKTTPAGMRMVEMLMQLFPAFQQTANAAEALRKQQTAAVRSMRDLIDKLNGVSDPVRAQNNLNNAVGDVAAASVRDMNWAWLDTLPEMLGLTNDQIGLLKEQNPALYDLVYAALQAKDALDGLSESATAQSSRFTKQTSVQTTYAAQKDLRTEISKDKAIGADGLAAITAALAAGGEALSKLPQIWQNAAQELADSNEAMHLAALGLQKVANDAHQDKSGKWNFSAGEMENLWADQFKQIFGSAGEALTAGGGDFGTNTEKMIAMMQAELARQSARILTEGVDQYGHNPAEIPMKILGENIAALVADLTKYQGYESQYKGHGKELLDLDAWKKAQMALAMGNQDAIDAINESYATQFEKIIAGATEGADTATKAWSDFRESLRSSLEDVGLSDMAKRIKDIGRQYEDNVKKAKELADAAGVGRTQVDTAQGKLTGLLDKGDILAAQKLAKQQQIAALESALPEGSLGSEELRRARADLVALTSAQAANSEEVRRARERLQALLGSQVDLDDALKDAEALRLALLNKLHSDWAAGLSSKLEDIGLSDTGRALKALREEFEKNKQAAIDLGGSTADLTLATALYKAQLDKMLSDFMAPISEQLAMLGLSDHEKAIYDINKAYEENMRKARELGATVGQLAEIEALRNAQLQQLAKQEAESNLRAAYDAQAAALQKIIDAADGAKDKLQGAFDTAFNEVDGLRQKFIDFADSLKAFNASLTLNAPSTTNDQKGALLQADFADLVSRAIKGDEKAYGGLQGSAQALLDYRRDSASTAFDYARSLGMTQAGLQQAEDAARNQATDLETQINLAKQQVGTLIDLKDVTKKSWRESLDIAVDEYRTTMDAAESAKTQLALLQTQVGALIDIKDAINGGNKSMSDLAAAVQAAIAAMLAASKPVVTTPKIVDGGNMLPWDATRFSNGGGGVGQTPIDPNNPSYYTGSAAQMPDAALIERLITPQNDTAISDEFKQLREVIMAGNSAIASNTKDTAKVLKQFNIDGMPATRT